MKSFVISNSEPEPGSLRRPSVTIEVESLRALRVILKKKGSGPEIGAVSEALSEDHLLLEEVETIRSLEIEFAREIAEFQKQRRPLRKITLPDGGAAIFV